MMLEHRYFHVACSCPAFVSKHSLNRTHRRDEGLFHSEDLSRRPQRCCLSTVMSMSSPQDLGTSLYLGTRSTGCTPSTQPSPRAEKQKSPHMSLIVGL